jgi:hypothetical protein
MTDTGVIVAPVPDRCTGNDVEQRMRSVADDLERRMFDHWWIQTVQAAYCAPVSAFNVRARAVAVLMQVNMHHAASTNQLYKPMGRACVKHIMTCVSWRGVQDASGFYHILGSGYSATF